MQIKLMYFTRFIWISFFSIGVNLNAQNWIDSAYLTADSLNIQYGTSIDFAGNSRDLFLDISYPLNDQTPKCGRPLILIIHGGAFMAGDKTEASIVRLRKEFAQRGYVAVALNYRLGLFQTSSAVNCNISNFGVEWNCLNMSDTAEWYRAYYRGVQDVNGCLRFIINRSADFKINPEAVFICGESAGGFIAMGASYIDDSSEVLQNLVTQLSNVPAPNSIYESDCIQSYGLDTSISSMKLERPDLGNYHGQLNLPLLKPYRILGCGNMYGAVFNNIFDSFSQNPGLYLFHQPNDLIVPFQKAQIFSGFAYCATQFPFSCQYIVNRPLVYGSSAIQNMIQNMSLIRPSLQSDFSNNNANCAQQIANPSLSGHAYDNFVLRSKNMAVYFASLMDSCQSNSMQALELPRFTLYPNPISQDQGIALSGQFHAGDIITLFNTKGQIITRQIIQKGVDLFKMNLTEFQIHSGFYIIRIDKTSFSKYLPLLIH